MVGKSQEFALAGMALVNFFRRGFGEEEVVYRRFLETLAGCDLVEHEFSGQGVLIAGTLDVSPPQDEKMGDNFRMLSFYFKGGDLALLNDATSGGATPLSQGTWRQALERIVVEYQRAHEAKLALEDQLIIHTLLRTIYRQ